MTGASPFAGQGSAGGDVLRLLAVGDIYGSVGLRALRRLLPGLRRELRIDITIVNGENSAGGRGVSMATAREIRDAGADVITSGNHIWAQPDHPQVLADDDLRVVRPMNFPDPAPGRGVLRIVVKGQPIIVANVQGRAFMDPHDDPFRAVDDTIDAHQYDDATRRRPFVIVDVHAEASSEKQALAWHLDGRATAVFGTHTHVPTADARVLPGGTGYVTDLGFTGARDSIIGAAVEPSLQRFLTGRPARLHSPERGDAVLQAVLFEIDVASGTCRSVTRVDRLDSAD